LPSDKRSLLVDMLSTAVFTVFRCVSSCCLQYTPECLCTEKIFVGLFSADAFGFTSVTELVPPVYVLALGPRKILMAGDLIVKKSSERRGKQLRNSIYAPFIIIMDKKLFSLWRL